MDLRRDNRSVIPAAPRGLWSDDQELQPGVSRHHALTATGGITPDNLAKQLADNPAIPPNGPATTDLPKPGAPNMRISYWNNPEGCPCPEAADDTYMSSKSEGVSLDSALTVEHILPQQWIAKWPLPDGAKAMTTEELWTAAKDDPRAEAT
ncbi:MAG: hypothetical protein U1E74_07825 [Paenacidovorax caeni]